MDASTICEVRKQLYIPVSGWGEVKNSCGNLCFPRVCPTAVGCNSGNSGELQWEKWEVGAVGNGELE